MTDEVREKIAAALRGRPTSARQKIAVAEANRRRVQSAETRAKISAGNTGKRKPSTKGRLWSRAPGYKTLHYRVYSARGKASANLCVDCGRQARHWSQIHNTSGQNVMDYEPRCGSCHQHYDRRGRAA